MNGNLSGFDAGAVAPNTGFDVLPAGEYDVVIVSSVVEPTSKGDGKFLKLELQVLNGEFQNRKLWDRLNLWNPSAKATEIARGTLSAICRAVGVLTPGDSSELHNRPLRIKVKVEKSEEYGEQNKVTGYKPRNGQPAQPVAPQAAASPWPMTTATPSPAYQETARQAGNVF
jgi:hypothetical protein